MFISDAFTGQRVLNVDSLTTEKCIRQTLQIDQVFISISNICECIVKYILSSCIYTYQYLPIYIQGQNINADIILKCTGLVPNNVLTQQVFGKIYLYFENIHSTSKCISMLYFGYNDHFISPLMQCNTGKESFDENSRLKVDRNLVIEGHTNIYAIGDCCNTKVYMLKTPQNKIY